MSEVNRMLFFPKLLKYEMQVNNYLTAFQRIDNTLLLNQWVCTCSVFSVWKTNKQTGSYRLTNRKLAQSKPYGCFLSL